MAGGSKACKEASVAARVFRRDSDQRLGQKSRGWRWQTTVGQIRHEDFGLLL